MKAKWVCICLVGGLCILPIRMAMPTDVPAGKASISVGEKKLDLNHNLVLAEKGGMSGVPLRLGDLSIEQIVKSWGEPSETSFVDGSYYAFYSSRQISIGYNRAGVFELRNEAPEVQELSTSVVLAALGPPAEIRQTKWETTYIYRTGKHELSILFDQEKDRALSQSVYSSKLKERGEYFLKIKGDSSALTEPAQNGMNKWRKEMEAFIQQNPLSISSNGLNRKQVALTFNDGPDQRVTEEILDILDEYNVQANFFFLGSQAAAYPQIVQEAYDNGHLIANHSYDHVPLANLTDEQIHNQIDESAHEIKAIIGKTPAIFRPPYGEINGKMLPMLSENGRHTVIWSVDTLDWSVQTADEITGNVRRYVRGGDIILMHSNAEQKKTAEALPKILDYLLSSGYEMVKLDDMLGVNAYED